MKRSLILLTALFLFPCLLSAQDLILDTTAVPSSDYSKVSISINGGMSFSFMDVSESKKAPVLGIGLQYTPAPGIGFNIDAQAGTLKAGDRTKPASSNMEFKNNFISGSLTLRFYPFRALAPRTKEPDEVKTGHKLLGGIYGGIGLGAILNRADAFDPGFTEAGYIPDPDGIELLMPLEVGYSLPLGQINASYTKGIYGKSLLSLNINYRHNLGFSEKMDGYNPSGASNKGKDAYSTLSLGLIYNF